MTIRYIFFLYRMSIPEGYRKSYDATRRKSTYIHAV